MGAPGEVTVNCAPVPTSVGPKTVAPLPSVTVTRAGSRNPLNRSVTLINPPEQGEHAGTGDKDGQSHPVCALAWHTIKKRSRQDNKILFLPREEKMNILSIKKASQQYLSVKKYYRHQL